MPEEIPMNEHGDTLAIKNQSYRESGSDKNRDGHLVAIFSLKRVGQFFGKLFEDWQSVQCEKRAEVTGVCCRRQFIACLQAGLCPHKTLEEFVEELLKPPMIHLRGK